MKSVSFSVIGTPMPKGSTTRMPHGVTIPAGTVESRKRMEQWRTDIRNEARKAMGDEPPMQGPIRFQVEFAFVPPKSIRKRDLGRKMHTTKPDVDKLFRMLGDALTGIVWRDDSQVCLSAVNKMYAWDGVGGAHVVIDELDDEACERINQTTQFVRSQLRKAMA